MESPEVRYGHVETGKESFEECDALGNGSGGCVSTTLTVKLLMRCLRLFADVLIHLSSYVLIETINRWGCGQVKEDRGRSWTLTLLRFPCPSQSCAVR